MPFKIFSEGDGKFCVWSLTDSGEKKTNHGCHPSQAEAENQARAMYANGADKDVTTKDLSAWGLTGDAADSKGTLRTLFSGKVHDAFTCVTDQLTMRGYLSQAQNKELTDIKGAMLKLFNEQVPSEIADILIEPSVLDEIASYKELAEQPSQFISIKAANSLYQWVMITSSSFRDRDGEIVSQKAHEADIAQMEQTGNHGTLDWFHLHPTVFQYLERPEDVAQLPPVVQKEGVILGDCTFSAMYGKLRIEAGTYRSKAIADTLNAHKDELSASLLFWRPINEPDSDGIFHHITTVSRAIMPKQRVSNLAPFLSNLQGA